MHVSLEVLTLAIDAMLSAGGLGADLEHTTRSALNTACAQLKEARKLSQILSHAQQGAGQDRAYFRAVAQALDELHAGGVLLLPWQCDSETDLPGELLLIIRRGHLPHDDTCTFTVVNPDRRAAAYHPADGSQPPKLKYRTCLEVGGVPFERLGNEAWWVVLWYAMNAQDHMEEHGSALKRQPLEVLYEVLIPSLVDDSLDRAIAETDGDAIADGGQPPPMRTLRRSSSAHYGCCRHALRYLLECAGAPAEECRRASLALRWQMLQMAAHDLGFVHIVSDAERRVLRLACRQLAYKASKLGSCGAIRPTHMSAVQREIGEIEQRLDHIAAPLSETAPPPLILSPAEEHLGRPSLETLLGELLVMPPGGAETTMVMPPGGAETTSPLAFLEGVEVLGLYFAASWCPSCTATTPTLSTSYRALRARGHGLRIVFVHQEQSEADYDDMVPRMPWPALPYDSHLSAYLAQKYQIGHLPTLVLLDATGALISTDGVRLLRRHTRAFPWGMAAPHETPHLHPLCERLLRSTPVDPGQSYDLPKYKPLDFLLQPQRVHTLLEALAALRECDILCTQTAVQSHSVLNTNFLKIAVVQHTFTCLLPMPKPEGEKVGAVFSKDCLWRTPMMYNHQLGLRAHG